MVKFGFELLQKDKRTKARLGIIHTPHGDIQTPSFVPVGTQATVKSLTPEELNILGVQLYFVNTYHMYLRPGIEVIKKFEGLHKFMDWDKPLMTDSGGFQVFSLARKVSLVKISDEGVEFQSHWDGSKHVFTPESSMGWQWDLGSDIHIAFDDCTPYPVTHEKAKTSMERTHRWAARSLYAHRSFCHPGLDPGSREKKLDSGSGAGMTRKPYQALYGSIQGSVYEDLRIESAKFISNMDFDGFAIGGVSVGESKKEMADAVGWVMPYLPDDKPRHLLGVGEVDDIFMLVEAGIDTFDCVQPTRLARMGTLYDKKTQIDITKAHFENDEQPIEKSCKCYTCQHFSRAYLHHLFHVRELLGYRLATIHNIFFIQSLVSEIRESIKTNSFLELKDKWL